jgi:glyoxylase-like metal-dependent hydrolase (beta-lactamase superfamily II)
LLILSDDTAVYPGHGDDTTIGEARRRHADFSSRSHPADMSGDVDWLKS